MDGRFGRLLALLIWSGVLSCALTPAPALAQSPDVAESPVLAQSPVVAQNDDDGIRSSYEDRRSRGKQPEYRRNTAGDFDYYALVLSWSPTHCSQAAGRDDALQCNRQDGRRYSFIVHGLWPQYERGWPENCNRTGSSFIPEQMIERMLDVMPSKQLIIHEYRKHGTCSGLTPFAYFEFVRKEFAEIKIPERYVNPFESQFVAPEDFAGELIEMNPGLKPEMIAVSCGGAGNRLKEIHICLTKTGEPTACGANENAKRMCQASKMFIPPVRSSAADADTAEARQKILPKQTPLPMPRVIPWSDE